jgi:hypothetical protein
MSIFFPGTSFENQCVVGQPVTLVLNCQEDSGNPQQFGPYTFTMLSGSFAPGLAMTPPRRPVQVNGVIAIIGTPTTPGTYNSVWRATDITGAHADANIQVVVNALQPRRFIMPGALVGNPYSLQLTPAFGTAMIAATGGFPPPVPTPPYTYGPVTIIFDAATLADFNMTFAGDTFASPSVAQFGPGQGFGFRPLVPVTDSIGNTASGNLSDLELGGVGPLAPTLVISGSPAPPVASLRTLYLHVFPISGGVPPYNQITLASGALPPGLVLRPRDLASVHGTPTALGTYTFTVRVEDSFGNIATTAPVSVLVTAPGFQGTQPGFGSRQITGGGTI